MSDEISENKNEIWPDQHLINLQKPFVDDKPNMKKI